MTTYGYVRVSTAEQTDGSSLADQERVIRGCAMMRGTDEVTIFSDPDVSGYSIPLAERPAGGRMMAVLRRGDVLIVSKMDRIFRNGADAMTCAQKFRHLGIGLIICSMGYEPVTESATGKMFFGMLALVAEFERDCIMERTADGRRGKKAKGGHVGGAAPYGYQVSGDGKAAMLVEYLPEQKIIRLIGDLYKLGLGPTAIARRLLDDGLTNREGKPFAKMTIQRILGRVQMGEAA